MDLWVVAAATGAGYIAKYWQAIHGDQKDASSDHNHHQFNEADKSQGISRIWDHQIRSSNLPKRKCVWDDDQMNIITENESFNSSGTGFLKTSYDVHQHIIDDLLLATKTFHPGIISLTSRNPIKPISTMSPTIRPVLVTDGHRITSVGRNQEKEKPQRKQTSSAVEAASGFVLLFIGITIGVMTAAKACKGEMDYLGKQLKDSDNLVQDLIDELDMKETITVNELNDHQFMSEIETELEAELVRLDIINIREPAAGSEKIHELDNQFYPEEDDEDDSEYDTRTANYAVSPKELKLRLYEVLESRLETRIKELEEALEISQAQ